MNKRYRVKREGIEFWVPQWVDVGDWHYYTYTEGERKGERVKFTDRTEAYSWLDEQKTKEGEQA
jgi:hypothetical protein